MVSELSAGGDDGMVLANNCELGFDTPFGRKDGIPVGWVGIGIWGDEPKSLPGWCEELVRVADALVDYLPPSR